MTPVSQWNASARAASPRLRRADRLVIGSFDGAAHVFQRRARSIILGSAVVMVPMVALGLALSVVAFRDFDSFDSLFRDRGYVGVESGSVFFALVVQSFTAHLLGAVLGTYLVAHQMGGEPSMRSSLASALRRSPTLLLTWFLTHWWVMLVALGAVNEPSGFAAGGVLLAPILGLFAVPFVVVTPVMMTERLGLRALARSWRLSRQRFGAVYGFVVLCTVLGGALFVFIAELPVLLQATGLVTFGSVGYLVQGVTTQLALLVVLPLVALASAQLYLQLRVHAEGLDLTLAADRAFGPRP